MSNSILKLENSGSWLLLHRIMSRMFFFPFQKDVCFEDFKIALEILRMTCRLFTSCVIMMLVFFFVGKFSAICDPTSKTYLVSIKLVV